MYDAVPMMTPAFDPGTAYSFEELPATIVPNHLVVLARAALIQQHSGLRYGGRSVVFNAGEGNALGDREHLAHNLPARGVEGLGHQRVFANEQQTAGCKNDAGLVRQNAPVLLPSSELR